MVGLSFKMLQECKVSFRRNKTRTNTQSRAGQEGEGAEGGTGRRPTNVRPTPNLQDVCECASCSCLCACLAASALHP